LTTCPITLFAPWRLCLPRRSGRSYWGARHFDCRRCPRYSLCKMWHPALAPLWLEGEVCPKSGGNCNQL